MDELLATARRTLTNGANHLRLSQSDIDRLIAPERTLEVTIPLQVNGSSRLLKAWRVQHNLRRGPGKGGVRYSQDVHQAEVTGLATIMSIKNSLAELPFGGAKGGVSVNTADLDEEGRQQLAEAVARAWANFIGPHSDILGPDVGTGAFDMDAISEAWRAATGSESNAVATGKSMKNGGIDLRNGATAAGCAVAISVARERTSLGTDAPVAIQGFGALGRGLAEILSDAGHPIVAVSDSGGGIYDPDGLDIKSVIEAKEANGSVSDADGKKIGSLDVLTVDAQIVVPAALQSVIDADVAENIKARLVVEGSNGPSTTEGIARLEARDIAVVPDFAANAGGVVGSFYEWKSNLGEGVEDADQAMSERMRKLNSAAWDRADSDRVDLRTAAAAIAIEGILDA